MYYGVDDDRVHLVRRDPTVPHTGALWGVDLRISLSFWRETAIGGPTHYTIASVLVTSDM